MDKRDKQLKFLVDFSTNDLDSFRPGDWLNLKDDIEKVFGISADYKPQELEQLPAIQKELRIKLGTYVFYLVQKKKVSFRLEIEVGKLIYVWSRERNTLEEKEWIHGNLRDLFLTRLVSLLKFSSKEYLQEKLRFCARKECKKLFFRTGRKLYCSRRCAVAASVQALKEREAQRQTSTRKRGKK